MREGERHVHRSYPVKPPVKPSDVRHPWPSAPRPVTVRRLP